MSTGHMKIIPATALFEKHGQDWGRNNVDSLA